MTEPAPEIAPPEQAPAESAPAVSPEKPGKIKAEKKPLPLKVRFFRWLMWFLILFGGGILLALLAFYIPAANQIQRLRADQENASQQLSALQSQLESSKPLETQNQDLQTQLNDSKLHVNLLSARLDVANAQYYLAKTDPAKARVALSQTASTLTALGSLLPSDQSTVVGEMQDRLKLALNEIESNSYAAQSDLDVLAKSLLELDSAYFSKP